MTNFEHQRLLACRDYVLRALCQEMEHRDRGADAPAWIEREREAVAMACNSWAQTHGFSGRATVADVERIETCALGHIDYASKLALYMAEMVLGVSR